MAGKPKPTGAQQAIILVTLVICLAIALVIKNMLGLHGVLYGAIFGAISGGLGGGQGQVAQGAPGGSIGAQTEDILRTIDRLLSEAGTSKKKSS